MEAGFLCDDFGFLFNSGAAFDGKVKVVKVSCKLQIIALVKYIVTTLKLALSRIYC